MPTTRQTVLKHEAGKKQTESIVANIAFLAFLPVLDAIAGLVTPELLKVYGAWPVAALWAILLILHIVFWWRANPSPQSMWKMIVEAEEQEKVIDELDDDVEALSQSLGLLFSLSALNLSTRRMVVNYVRRQITSVVDLSEAIQEMMSPLFLQGETFFDLQGSEKWNFAVYLYSTSRDEIVPVWRQRSLNHPSKGDGRPWQRGEGHVGKAFVNGRPIITGDSQHPDVLPLSATPPGKEQAYDMSVYRSFASIPIGPLLDGENQPYGVLVATSDRIGRFDKENTVSLLHMADVVGSLITLAGIQLDQLQVAQSAQPLVPEQKDARG